jgi:hypothetical protein
MMTESGIDGGSGFLLFGFLEWVMVAVDALGGYHEPQGLGRNVVV